MTCRPALLLLLLALLAGDLRGQDAFDKDAFVSRKKWYGSFLFTLKGIGNGTIKKPRAEYHSNWNILRQISGEFELDKIDQLGPRASKLAEGEKRAGRFISWDISASLTPVEYMIQDKMTHSSVTRGEAGAETEVKGFLKYEGAGATKIGRKKELKCDLKDMTFDLDFDCLRVWNREPQAKPFLLTGDYHDVTPATKVRRDFDYPVANFGINSSLMDVTPLLPQLLSRKLELKKGKIVFTASMPVTVFPFFPPHPGPEYGHRGNDNAFFKEGEGKPLELSLDIVLSPTPPAKVKLILTPPPDYETAWRPQCLFSETRAGNRFDLKWRVEEQGGDPARPAAVKRVTFSLLNTSREPGICMNFPVNAARPADFDLRFAKVEGATDHRVSADGQKLVLDDARVLPGKGDVTVDCFDSGANAVLVAEAELADGRVIKGVVEKTEAPQLPIPDHEPGVSRIAKHWVKNVAKGKSDRADDETFPPGDGQVGDGLTVWEEYRGFWVNDQWESGDPITKELFILNEIGEDADAGIEMFRSNTHLLIHDKMWPHEFRPDRIINFNSGEGPHLVDQHGIRLALGGTQVVMPGGVQSSASICHGVRDDVFPGPPKNTLLVSILPGMLYAEGPVTPGETPLTAPGSDRTIAHELGHALGIRHHGDKDEGELPWKYVYQADGPVRIFVAGVEVQVLDEDGKPLHFLEVFPVEKPGQESLQWIGERNGQHAGDDKCFMRYKVAQAYRSKSDPKVLYYHGGLEPLGRSLCRSASGDGVNVAGRSPQPRYFECDQGRGACQKKFVVSDRWDKKN